MEENRKLEMARRIVERTDCSLFLTGRAGTGKTTFLRELRMNSRKRMVVTAPTGIAAINAGGVTLHSFFQLDFSPFIPGITKPSRGRYDQFTKEKLKIIRGMDVLIIDEISMVRADLLDAVDDVLRRHRDRNRPFGGVQLLLIGDLQQLPPVVVDSEKELLSHYYRSPYFFDSHALQVFHHRTRPRVSSR
jgi:type II secretory pathway predicted ATPase ExeA